MRPADPTRRLFSACGGDVLEPYHEEIGDQLVRRCRPLGLIAAETRLTGLLSDLADARDRGEAAAAHYLTRAVADLGTAIAGARLWRRAALGFRRAA